MPETVESSSNGTESQKVLRYIHKVSKTQDQTDTVGEINKSILTRRRPSLIPVFQEPEWELNTSSKGKSITEKHDGFTVADLKPMFNMWQHQGFQSSQHSEQSKKKKYTAPR